MRVLYAGNNDAHTILPPANAMRRRQEATIAETRFMRLGQQLHPSFTFLAVYHVSLYSTHLMVTGLSSDTFRDYRASFSA